MTDSTRNGMGRSIISGVMVLVIGASIIGGMSLWGQQGVLASTATENRRRITDLEQEQRELRTNMQTFAVEQGKANKMLEALVDAHKPKPQP
jgi:hypothetical protein